MARVGHSIEVHLPAEAVLALVADYAQRHRFLPDEWRFIGVLTDATAVPGSQIEIEAKIGPAPVRYVFELLAVEDDLVVEGTLGGANYVMTWTVLPAGEVSVVECVMEFEYGGFIGEFFAGRRLSKALGQMLRRLKATAEAI